MTVGSADLHKAIHNAWESSGLNHTFRLLWPSSVDQDAFPVLHDQEATPGQPFPFCVIQDITGVIKTRMSGGVDSQRHVKDYEVRFVVQATEVESNGEVSTAKEVAARLAEEIMKQFGGHPTVKALAEITLDNGSHVVTQFQDDFGVRDGDQEHSWTVSYIFRLDVPVAC